MKTEMKRILVIVITALVVSIWSAVMFLFGTIVQGGVIGQFPISIGYGYFLLDDTLFSPPEVQVDRTAENAISIDDDYRTIMSPESFDGRYKNTCGRRISYYLGEAVVSNIKDYHLLGGIMFGRNYDGKRDEDHVAYFCVDLQNKEIFATRKYSDWQKKMKQLIPNISMKELHYESAT